MATNAFDGDREWLRCEYFRTRKEAGLPIEPDPVIEAKLDRAQEHLNAKRAAKANPAATSPPVKAVQPPLFDAGTDTAETRRLAAAPALQRLPIRCQRALSFLISRGTYGAIPDEISVHLDIPAHSTPSIVGRLREEGLIVATSERRPTRYEKLAVVYVAALGVVDGSEVPQ